ncbi:hypothetical protein A3K72_01190 [Candidatus Woesearchaeota archaeon RBG_13_36_6]|nr:MAG: hypothetical protein A3K72_01190 [Candidatus Woesearchaeota archaeon RBG_13_36_6]
MKHPITPTIMLILLFFTAQLAGLIILGEYIDIKQTHETGKTVKNIEVYKRVGVEPPEVENESFTFIIILIAVLIGTGIVLLIIKFRKKVLWQLWYFLAVLFSLVIALNPFVFKILNQFNLQNVYLVTVGLAIILSLLKVFKPNVYVHNFTEIFIYGGIAALLVPVINIFSAVLLLVLISLYDAYAVWKSKHMIKMAEFQSVSKVFAGLSVPYAPLKIPNTKKDKMIKTNKNVKTAILGGGDVAFPIIFAGAVMKTTGSYLAPLIITLTTTIALVIILLKGEKGKFYPAMPFLSIGCFVGFLLAMLLV